MHEGSREIEYPLGNGDAVLDLVGIGWWVLRIGILSVVFGFPSSSRTP